jgi:putative phosphoribosyl transferase
LLGGGIEVLNEGIVRSLKISKEQLAVNILVAKRKLMQMQFRLRGERPYPNLSNRVIILVDDGIARPAKVRAAIQAIRKVNSKRIIFAVPIITPKVKSEIEAEVDQLVTISISESSTSIPGSYEEFSRVADYKAQMLLG